MFQFSLILVIGLALLFDFVNGFHDAANSIATVVATRVLSPYQAVLWAAFWNFIAFVVFGTAVAKFIANGVISTEIVSIGFIFAALVGAIIWNLITAWLGLPSSSSHALVGGLIGAACAKAGWHAVDKSGLRKTGVFIVYSPLIGLALALILVVSLMWVGNMFKNVKATNKAYRRMQLVSAAAFSLGHGANDAQKTMGLILALLIGANKLPKGSGVPIWVVLSAHAAIGLGTLLGGWRIVRTMGNKLTRLQPMGGFAAETAAAITLFFTSAKGIPVSTTHTITGAIVGVGSAQRVSAVRWGVAGQVFWAWILTVPVTALLSAGTYGIVRALS
jgi:PiT family inorganic phosphate transporter